MGLKTFAKKQIIKQFLEYFPMVSKLVSWLSDPKAVGRKRTIATIAALISAMIKGGTFVFKAACDAGDFGASVCKLDPGMIASTLDLFVTFLNTVVVQGADIITILVGAWGLWAARDKTAVVLDK